MIELVARVRMVALFWPGWAGRSAEENDWLLLQVSRGAAGVLTSAAALAADPYNIVGLRERSPAFKSRTEQLLLKAGLGATLEAARVKIDSLCLGGAASLSAKEAVASLSAKEADVTLSAAEESGPLQDDAAATRGVQIARPPPWDNILCLAGGFVLGLGSASSWCDAAVTALAGACIMGLFLLFRPMGM